MNGSSTIRSKSLRIRAAGGCIRIGIVGVTTLLLVATPGAFGDSKNDAFAAANTAAMNKMMSGMDIRPSSDIDADFAAMMIPHHQGAIDMAVAELRYGSNEKMRRIAQEIVVEQQQEIAAMQLALGHPAPGSMPFPTSGDPARADSPSAHAVLTH